MPAFCSAAASTSRAKCGYRLDAGTTRISTRRVISYVDNRERNSWRERVEWPTVKIRKDSGCSQHQQQVLFEQRNGRQPDCEFLRPFGHPRALGAGMYPARRAVAVWRIQGRRLRVQRRLCEHIQRGACQTNGVPGRGMTLMNVFHWQPGIQRPQPGDLLVPPPRHRVHLAERIAHHGGGVEQVPSDASLHAGLRMVLEFAGITAEYD